MSIMKQPTIYKSPTIYKTGAGGGGGNFNKNFCVRIAKGDPLTYIYNNGECKIIGSSNSNYCSFKYPDVNINFVNTFEFILKLKKIPTSTLQFLTNRINSGRNFYLEVSTTSTEFGIVSQDGTSFRTYQNLFSADSNVNEYSFKYDKQSNIFTFKVNNNVIINEVLGYEPRLQGTFDNCILGGVAATTSCGANGDVFYYNECKLLQDEVDTLGT